MKLSIVFDVSRAVLEVMDRWSHIQRHKNGSEMAEHAYISKSRNL